MGMPDRSASDGTGWNATRIEARPAVAVAIGLRALSPITAADRTMMFDKPTPAKTDDHLVVLRTMSGTWWIFAVAA